MEIIKEKRGQTCFQLSQSGGCKDVGVCEMSCVHNVVTRGKERRDEKDFYPYDGYGMISVLQGLTRAGGTLGR